MNQTRKSEKTSDLSLRKEHPFNLPPESATHSAAFSENLSSTLSSTLSTTLSVLLLLILSLSHLFLSNAHAQVVNVERHRVTVDTTHVWTGGLGFGLNISQNKSQIVRFNTSADLTYTGARHSYLLLGRNNFLRVEGENVLNDGFVHFRTVLFRDNVYAPELFLQAQYNLDWGLLRRLLAGSNLRIRLHYSEQLSAFVSTGFMLESEEWKVTTKTGDVQNPESTQRRSLDLLKSTTSVNIRGRITENLQVAAISYYQARPDKFFRPRFTSDWQLRFRISEDLRFVMQFVSTFDANPPLQSQQFIYQLNNVLEIRF